MLAKYDPQTTLDNEDHEKVENWQEESKEAGPFAPELGFCVKIKPQRNPLSDLNIIRGKISYCPLIHSSRLSHPLILGYRHSAQGRVLPSKPIMVLQPSIPPPLRRRLLAPEYCRAPRVLL